MGKIRVSKYDDDGHHWREVGVGDFTNEMTESGVDVLGNLINVLHNNCMLNNYDLDLVFSGSGVDIEKEKLF